MRRAFFLITLLSSLFWISQAHADVTLPNGQVVPVDSGSEVQLYTLFANEGEAIDWQKDAHATPDTFSPLCGFTATLVLKQSGSSFAVGWYNVVPGATAPPMLTEIYPVVPAGSAVGTVITGQTIRGDAHYLGGSVGFALIRKPPDPPNFSQSGWSILYAANNMPWILSLTYKSVTTPDTYYLAFEDGNTTAFGWSNDGDYNDYVFRFTGLACTGAGAACQVPGAQGACADGLTECDASGKLVCKELVAKAAETCDGVDNDCNGKDDDGKMLCPPGKQCVRGSCVPPCGQEFPCFNGDVCENGLCVNPACVGKTCAAGQACIAGDCRAPCDGVKCPGEQVCRAGRCVDACAGVTCDQGYVCDGGVCLVDCSCGGCGTGLACRSDGICVAAGCETQSCASTDVCVAGACVDACQGAVCPLGERCKTGKCQASGADVQDGSDGGLGLPASADASIPRSFSPDASASGDGGGQVSRGRQPGADTAGCGCTIARGSDRPSGAGFAPCALLVFALVWRRRRARFRTCAH